MKFLLFALLAFCGIVQAAYEPNWKSLDSRPIPEWYDQAKFGLFIHWGVYSVPAWAEVGLNYETPQQLGEWYQYNMRQPNTPVYNFHKETYGSASYTDFAPDFKPTLWDPDRWADIFEKAGAKYIVLTSKHCDGYALWPSKQKQHWNAGDVGPERDLVGPLLDSVKKRGIHTGLYYCNFEWYNDKLMSSTPHDYITETWIPMYKDLINTYKPEVVWGDYAINYPSSWWNSTELLAWIYNESPIKDYVVVDDRWGNDTRGVHGGFSTVEYGHGTPYLTKKWEFNRGIGYSFGYNRQENVTIYSTAEELIQLLVDTVAHNGNLLLDVGPTADGRIDNVQAERILQIGTWLSVNGEGIYNTKPWTVQKEPKSNIWYTQNKSLSSVYAFIQEWPAGGKVTLESFKEKPAKVILFGHTDSLSFTVTTSGLEISLPPFSPSLMSEMWAFKIVMA